MLAELPRGAGRLPEPALLTHALGLPPGDMPLPLYTRAGDWLGIGCAALTATVLAAALAEWRRTGARQRALDRPA